MMMSPILTIIQPVTYRYNFAKQEEQAGRAVAAEEAATVVIVMVVDLPSSLPDPVEAAVGGTPWAAASEVPADPRGADPDLD